MKCRHIVKEVKCKECKKYFKNSHLLKRHEQATHFQPRNKHSFECPICNLNLVKYQGLKRHVEDMHSAAEKLKITCTCDLCNVKYVSKLQMTIHMKVEHSGPYKCFDWNCEKRFTNPVYRRTHFKMFHNRDAAELQRLERKEFDFWPYKCLHRSCNKRFKYRNYMHRHYRTHSVVS